ncbi:MAG: universal stress protein [Anderseniella sp.]|nr:universal stress protein [Anderseniella sp.]
MYKTVLVPVDLSHIEKGSKMIERAKYLADTNKSRLTLLNVIPEIPSYVAIELPSDLHAKVVENAEAELRDLVRKHDLPASTKVVVESGNPAGVILAYAEKEKCDLIMVASHQPGLKDYLLGSVAGKVVRHANCSVLVLR